LQWGTINKHYNLIKNNLFYKRRKTVDLLCSDIRWTAWFSGTTFHGFAGRTPAPSRLDCPPAGDAVPAAVISLLAVYFCASLPENTQKRWSRNSHRNPSSPDVLWAAAPRSRPYVKYFEEFRNRMFDTGKKNRKLI